MIDSENDKLACSIVCNTLCQINMAKQISLSLGNNPSLKWQEHFALWIADPVSI